MTKLQNLGGAEIWYGTVCPGSHFRETINVSCKNRHTDLGEGSLDFQLHARFNCINFFSFEAYLGDCDPVSKFLNSKQLHTRVISSL